MAGQPRMRFEEVELGQSLPVIDVATPANDAPLSNLIERFVSAWAGTGAKVDGVRITRQIRAPKDTVLKLAGRVYGRHMDGSRCVEVEVTGCDDLGKRLGGMVRVQLA